MSKTKAGYIAIIGKPNAGKSSLMNAILGLKLSIVTEKPQTTRKTVLGIHSIDDAQLIFLDTPGVLSPKYELHRKMMNSVDKSLAGADIITLLVDATSISDFESLEALEIFEFIRKSKKPSILLLNKIDLFKSVKEVLPVIQKYADTGLFKEIIPMSATKNTSIDIYINSLLALLPQNEFYYDAELLSVQSQRFFVSEIIREHIFKEFNHEVPYSCEVNIREYKERELGKWYISADIIVERDSQKPIIIGAKGSKIKIIGEKARVDIESHLQMPVFLELFVKVRQNWRNSETFLKSYGY